MHAVLAAALLWSVANVDDVPCGRSESCTLTVIYRYAIAVGTYAEPKVGVAAGMFMHDYHGAEACRRAKDLVPLEAHRLDMDVRVFCTPTGATQP